MNKKDIKVKLFNTNKSLTKHSLSFDTDFFDTDLIHYYIKKNTEECLAKIYLAKTSKTDYNDSDLISNPKSNKKTIICTESEWTEIIELLKNDFDNYNFSPIWIKNINML